MKKKNMDCVKCDNEIIGYFVDKTAIVCERNHLTCLDCDRPNSRTCKLCGQPTKYCQINPYEIDEIELLIDLDRQVCPTRRRRHYFNKSEIRDPLDDVIEKPVLFSEDTDVDSEEEQFHSKVKLHKKKLSSSEIAKKKKIPQSQFKTKDGVIITVYEKEDSSSSYDTEVESQISIPETSKSMKNKLKSISSTNTDVNSSISSASQLLIDESLSGLAQAFSENIDNVILGCESSVREKPLGACKFDESTSDSEKDEPKYPIPYAEVFYDNASKPKKIPLIDIDVAPIRSRKPKTSQCYNKNGLKLCVWHNHQNGDVNTYNLFIVTAPKNDKRMKFLLETLVTRDEIE